MPRITVQPLLPQHRGECGEQRNQEACEQETIDEDNLAGRVLLGDWNGGGFVWDCGMIEGEENGTEESCGFIAGVRLELFVDVDDENRANCREQARLQGLVRLLTG